MRKIKIIINGIGYNNINQASVQIFDMNNRFICQGNTYNSCICACLSNGCYKLKICSCYGVVNRILHVIKYLDTYYINLNCININNNINNNITFRLTDFNYNNLPIEKGTLIL